MKTVVGIALALCAVVGVVSGTSSDSASQEQRAALEEVRREHRVFAFYTSTSVTRLATTTIAALSTCLSVQTTACQGRRKRSPFSNVDKLVDESDQLTLDLDASLTKEDDAEEEDQSAISERLEGDDRDGKKLTIWSTNYTTLTITSTSYYTGTTVTATALCSVAGLTAGCFGK